MAVVSEHLGVACLLTSVTTSIGFGSLVVAKLAIIKEYGLDAAIVMGRARSALRAYALESVDPATVLTRLDAKLKHFEAGAMATVIYGVLEPGFGRLRIASAGHLPPIIASAATGTAQRLDLPVDPPIGVATRARRRVTDVELTPGDVLCFYTDGVRLVLDDSPVLEELRALESQGVHLIICKTCLDAFGVADRVAVGVVGGMGDIIAAQWTAGKCITKKSTNC